MAGKPWLKKNYTLIIVPHAEAKFRKVKLPYWLMMLVSSISAVVLTALIAFVVHYFLMLDDVSNLERLAEENQRLSKENARYELLTSTLDQRLAVVEDKTKVLSAIVGVKTVETRGMGDISGLDERFNNEILDRDLPLNKLKVDNISATLDRVEKAFNENQELLDHTPSIWPLISTDYGRITSGRGMRDDPFTGKRRYHKGIDISVDRGTPVIAPANGVVSECERNGGLGNLITVDHGMKFVTRYGHLSKFNVKVGDVVKRGDVIGYVGNTGRSTAPHLHYEVHFSGKDVNPKSYILNYSNIPIPVWDTSVLNRR